MHDHAARLVDDDDVRILIEDIQRDVLCTDLDCLCGGDNARYGLAATQLKIRLAPLSVPRYVSLRDAARRRAARPGGSEVPRLQRAYESKKAEIQTYETNLTFLNSKSKAGNSLVADIERRIQTLRNDLEIIAESKESGVSIVRSRNRYEFFITGHLEYAPDTLDREYHRDLGKRDDVEIPKHYYREDDPMKGPLVTWRAHANLLFMNWVKLIATPFSE